MAVEPGTPNPADREKTRVILLDNLRARLAPLRSKAATKLRKITIKQPRTGAERLRFEMHDVCETFSVELFAEDESPSGRHLASVFREASIPGGASLDWDEYWASGIDPWAVVQQAIIDTIADAWGDADGAAYPLPAVICHHDDAREFDLVRRRWVTDHLGQPLLE